MSQSVFIRNCVGCGKEVWEFEAMPPERCEACRELRERRIRERVSEIAPLKLSREALVEWIANLEMDFADALLDAVKGGKP